MPAGFRPHGKAGPAAKRHDGPPLEMDREAVAAGLRQYLDLILPATHFDLRFTIELPHSAVARAATVDGEGADGNTMAGQFATSPAGATDEFETPDVIVAFDGDDRELLLERGAEVLKALEHLALRSLRL